MQQKKRVFPRRTAKMFSHGKEMNISSPGDLNSKKPYSGFYHSIVNSCHHNRGP